NPACPARRNASCTRLILTFDSGSLERCLFLLPSQYRHVVVHRSTHHDSSHHNGASPCQPHQPSLPPHQQRVLEQWDTAQNREIRIGPDILQVLQRCVLHLLGGGEHKAHEQTAENARGCPERPVRLGGPIRQKRRVQHFELFAHFVFFDADLRFG